MEHSDDKKEKQAEEKSESAARELEECKRQAREYLEGWKRAKADFINYKNEEKERIQYFGKFACRELIRNLLPVLDTFDEALKYSAEGEHIRKIAEQMLGVLAKEGLQPISATNVPFDPKIHEAVTAVEGSEPHMVVEVIQKGYRLHDIVLRAAKVKVNK